MKLSEFISKLQEAKATCKGDPTIFVQLDQDRALTAQQIDGVRRFSYNSEERGLVESVFIECTSMGKV